MQKMFETTFKLDPVSLILGLPKVHVTNVHVTNVHVTNVHHRKLLMFWHFVQKKPYRLSQNVKTVS